MTDETSTAECTHLKECENCKAVIDALKEEISRLKGEVKIEEAVKSLTITEELDPVEEKVRRYLEATDNIAILNEYCQQRGAELPQWSSTSALCGGSYQHSVTLQVGSDKFAKGGFSKKTDGQKYLAEQAIMYYEKQKIPFFNAKARNYVGILQQLCQQQELKMMPVYDIVANTSGFSGVVKVGNHSFKSDKVLSRKKQAKDDVAEVAFKGSEG
jgi:dsRNA-specific ribonuclease